MGYILFALFVGVPILEIAVLIAVGGQIGVWPTIGAVIATAFAGSVLLRWQGLSTLFRAQEHLDRGELPVAELFDGVCLVGAGVLLLTPGFVTDAFGLLLFFPPFRLVLRKALWSVLLARGVVHMHSSHGSTNYGPNGGDMRSSGPTIDGDFQVVEPDEDDSNKDSNTQGKLPGRRDS